MNFRFFIISIILTSGFVGVIFAETVSAEKEFSQKEIDEMKLKAVLITMNDGTFTIGLFPEDAPNTVHNFLKLVESGYYDGIVFHRILPGFMIQAGDPNTKNPEVDRSSWGRGGPGYTINAEFNTLQHDRGIVSMARSQHPDSAGSQFFIVHKDSNFLDGQYTAFGKLVPGTYSNRLLDTVANLVTDARDAPLDVSRATITKATILDDFTATGFGGPDRNESIVTETTDVTPTTITTEPVAEPKTVAYATLPPGVKSPAPNFESNFKGDDYQGVPYTYLDTEDGLTISELYAYWDYEWNSGSIKIVSGDGKDLLVWYATLDCSECSIADEVKPQNFKMYDGKDRKFSIITSSIWGGGIGGMVENPNFSWSEDCSPFPVTVQPGVIDEMEICFEIPKNSDHFKFTEYSYGETRVLALLDRSTISNTASKGSQSGGGCLIATAAFGSEMAPQVQFLRELRDNTVLQTESGISFMTGFNQFYYSFSPAIADYERENPAFKEAVKIALTPLLTSLTLLQYADIDSESEMLGYGISIILLNIGMYFVAPAVLIMTVRKRI